MIYIIVLVLLFNYIIFMKTLINKLFKTFFIGTIIFIGAISAQAASFDSNPSSNTGIVSITNRDCSSNGCSGQDDSVSLNLNPGESATVTVFVDFMALRDSSQPVNGVRVLYHTKNKTNQSSRTYSFRATLSALNASRISDTAEVTGLPESYDIEYFGGKIENTHSTTDPDTCGSGYDEEIEIKDNLIFNNSGQDLGNLSNDRSGWCSQGTVAVTYKITNTENVVVNNPTIEVQTDYEENVDRDSVTLNGRIVSGETRYSFFVFNTNNNISCTSYNDRIFSNDFNNYRNSGDHFSAHVTGLKNNTTYYYQACASSINILSNTYGGDIKKFNTFSDSSTNNDEKPYAITNSARNIDEDFAELRGEIDMNDFKNGIVFFVYGQDRYEIRNTEDDHDSYYEVKNNEDKNDFEVVRVDTDLDNSDSYFESIRSLETNKHYYYQICVEYEDNIDETLECGGVKDFETETNKHYYYQRKIVDMMLKLKQTAHAM